MGTTKRAISPLKTQVVEKGYPHRFAVVAFYAGVHLNHEQQLKDTPSNHFP
jgi:hypothetical protein